MNLDLVMGLTEPLVFGSEGCRLTAYLDTIADPPKWTIGHGSTWVDGRPVESGMTCSRLQADAWAAADLRNLAELVMRVVKVSINEHQLAALTSLAFNIGDKAFEKSSVLQALNLALMQRAADRFLDYDEAGGHKVPGLLARRGRERALFLTKMAHDPSHPEATPAVASPSTGHLSGGTAVKPGPAQPTSTETTADELNQKEIDNLESSGRLTGDRPPPENDPPPPAV